MLTQESSYAYVLLAALAIAVAVTFAALFRALQGLQVFG
jgi:hypothetical protein